MKFNNNKNRCKYMWNCDLYSRFSSMCRYPTDLEPSAHEFRTEHCKAYQIFVARETKKEKEGLE